jgi:hypothetical protein
MTNFKKKGPPYVKTTFPSAKVVSNLYDDAYTMNRIHANIPDIHEVERVCRPKAPDERRAADFCVSLLNKEKNMDDGLNSGKFNEHRSRLHGWAEIPYVLFIQCDYSSLWSKVRSFGRNTTETTLLTRRISGYTQLKVIQPNSVV